jgi:nucleoside-diphosphate-sugar epimerase
MKVLVTGANGFVGQHLVKELKQHSIQLACVGRQVSNHDADELYVVTDFNDSSAWQEPLAACDVVIHLAARVHVMKEKTQNPLVEFRKVNVNGTLTLAKEAAKAGVKRFIYISSVKVNGESTELDAPFKETDKTNPKGAYGLSKLEAEQGLLKLAQETGMEVVIIRPPLVYGTGVKANFLNMMRAVNMELPLPLGEIRNMRSLVYVENLVSFIHCCIKHSAAANQVFFVSDGLDLSTTELLKATANALGVKARLIPVPQKLIEISARMLGKHQLASRLCGNLQVDITKARKLLGWVPPYTLEQGLKKTATYLNNLR